jgi:hypothetical protein
LEKVVALFIDDKMPLQSFQSGGVVSDPFYSPEPATINGKDISVVSHDLPAMNQMVLCPEPHASGPWVQEGRLRNVIMHINDSHGWTRERIADWIDELHDAGKINAEFQPWEEDVDKEPETPVQLKQGWKNLGYTTEPPDIDTDLEPVKVTGKVKKGDEWKTVELEFHGSLINYYNLMGDISNYSLAPDKTKKATEETMEAVDAFTKAMQDKKSKKPAWAKFTDKSKKGKKK